MSTIHGNLHQVNSYTARRDGNTAANPTESAPSATPKRGNDTVEISDAAIEAAHADLSRTRAARSLRPSLLTQSLAGTASPIPLPPLPHPLKNTPDAVAGMVGTNSSGGNNGHSHGQPSHQQKKK